MSQIKIANLQKSFGDFTAVKNSNLTIKDKEFFVLLGPSGCGKTTTLRMIAGLELPTSGEIYLGEEEVGMLRASERDIAFVFQLFALYPHMNVRNNLSFPLKMQGYSKQDIKNRVEEAAKLLRIDHILNSNISSLSGGDRQRVALGRALVRRPKAFLMDEPLGTLDAEFRELMCLELKKLHIEIGATTVYVTHDQLEAMSLADRIAVMDGGEILQADEPSIIYNKPKTKFVASFIGSPGMNFISLEKGISKDQSSIEIDETKFEIPKQFEESKENNNYFGIRPENLTLTDESGLKGSIYGIEYLGSRKIITVKTRVGEIKVRTDVSKKVKINENVQIKPSNNNIIIFDGSTDKSLKSEFMNNG
ncbi:ABC transporter ATP-binding protein [Candidatus Pelagibacter sp. HIMB1493]|uniref:ABC transporter ATP-binding protein n=1 Tax=Candidatus Pelagibacter sp. HIMB1493 TaxID=3413334 RepID=UPI003F85C7B2